MNFGAKAHELRRYVGSASWSVFEEMMQVATGPADRLVAEVSIRSLAARSAWRTTPSHEPSAG